LFNLLAAVSVVVMAVTSVEWTRSYSFVGVLETGTNLLSVTFTSWEGEVRAEARKGADAIWQWHRIPKEVSSWAGRMSQFCRWHFLGFGAEMKPGAMALVVPWWLLTVGFGVLSYAWVYRRIRRRGRGKCQCCGYDVRATITAGQDICPECGHRFGEAKSDQVP